MRSRLTAPPLSADPPARGAAADTRTRLLDVTAALLEDLGPARADQLTTRAVCDAAGVTAPTLYHHFGDKDGLVRAAVARAAEAYLAGKRALAPSGDPLVDLRRGWDAWTAFVTAHPALVALALACPDAAPGAAAEADALLGERVAAAARAGRLAVDTDIAAAAVRAAVDGVMALARRGEPAAAGGGGERRAARRGTRCHSGGREPSARPPHRTCERPCDGPPQRGPPGRPRRRPGRAERGPAAHSRNGAEHRAR
jgi:AcrR family transcriptional regulator